MIPTDSLKISIIGAGIGGLTTGVALQNKGVDVQIYEAAEILQPLGAGIILAPNAMEVYRRMGLYDQIMEAGVKMKQMTIADRRLKSLLINHLKEWETNKGVSAFAIARSALQQILLDAFPAQNLHLNKRIKTFQENDVNVASYFKDGSEVFSDVLIGADGLNSAVRMKMFPEVRLRSAGQWCWRGLSDIALPDAYANAVFELWGGALRFGFVQISKKKTYWFGLTNNSMGYKDVSLDELKNLFRAFHPIVTNILQDTEKDAVIFGEIQDIQPIQNWRRGRVCLIGDAAHPTTPNLGQGAGQAIEDAYSLANLFVSRHSLQDLFSTFQKKRKPKADYIVQTSWRLGKVAHWRNPVLCAVRNSAFRIIPDFVSKAANHKLFTLAE